MRQVRAVETCPAVRITARCNGLQWAGNAHLAQRAVRFDSVPRKLRGKGLPRQRGADVRAGRERGRERAAASAK